MELREIEILANKYLDAQSSLEEEAQLSEYLMNNDVPPHLQAIKDEMSFFHQAREVKMEKNFKVPVTPSEVKARPLKLKWVISVAASLVLMLGVYMSNTQSQRDLGSYNDPELAYQETKAALMMLSQNMNTGLEKVNHLKTMNEVQQQIVVHDYTASSK